MTDEQIARERFVAEGACGGQYAVVWDREKQQIVFPYLRTGASVSDDQIRAIAAELNALLARRALEARAEALEEAADAFEQEYIKHEGVMGTIRGLKAIRSLAAGGERP